MSNLFKTVYENCECTYTCGLPLRKFLRLLSIIGMISSIVYITVGICIIVHIVQTEKVEWFPNAYYRIQDPDGPVASRIVVPPPPSANGFPDYEIYRPKQNPHPMISFQPHPHTIFPVNDESNRLAEQQEKAIYYRRNVGLFICLAASLILINFIQLVTDACLFCSTLKGKTSTSYWVFFLLNIILWIMTLICFVTIFSGGGIFLLLVFLSGTAIRTYTVYALHELMSDLRKPRAASSSGESQEIKPEPRTVLDAEEGNIESETAEADETAAETTTDPDDGNDNPEPVASADEEDSTSSTKSLKPTQNEEGEDDAELVETENQELQSAENDKADNEEGEAESEAQEVDAQEEQDDAQVDEAVGENDGKEDAEDADNTGDGEDCQPDHDKEPETEEGGDEAEENDTEHQQENDNEDVESGEVDTATAEVEQEDNEEAENHEEVNEETQPNNKEEILGENEDENNDQENNNAETVPEEENGKSENNENITPELDNSESLKQEDGGNDDGDDATNEASQNGENESPETDSPTELGENEEQSPGVDEAVEDEETVAGANDPQQKRKRSRRKRRTKKT